LANIAATRVCTRGTEQIPVSNSICTQVNVLFDVSNTVKIVGVQLVSRDEQTTGFLENPPSRFRIEGTIVLAAM
jgi:hypothetical protein